jgi:hypothetical protein
MAKVLLALATAAAILAVGFVVLPKLLLHAPGASPDNTNANVPIGHSQVLAITPLPGGASPEARRFEDFASVQRGAGFNILTPASLPAGYQPWEQFLRPGDPVNVVLTYRKDGNLYLIIDERPHQPNDFGFPQPGMTPRGGFQNPDRFSNGRTVQRAIVQVGSTPAYYSDGLSPPAFRLLGGSDISRLNSQPHVLLFTRGNVDVAVEGDLTDIPRDQLIQIAVDLR